MLQHEESRGPVLRLLRLATDYALKRDNLELISKGAVVEKRRRVRTVFYYVAARDVEIFARFGEKTARMSADLFPLAVISGARMFQVYVS